MIDSYPSDSTSRYGRTELSEAGTWVTPIGELYEDTSQSLQPVEEKKSDEELYHNAFINFLLDRKVDSTYIIIANMQFKKWAELGSTRNPIELEKIERSYQRYFDDNKDQVDTVNNLRREFTTILARK